MNEEQQTPLMHQAAATIKSDPLEIFIWISVTF